MIYFPFLVIPENHTVMVLFPLLTRLCLSGHQRIRVNHSSRLNLWFIRFIPFIFIFYKIHFLFIIIFISSFFLATRMLIVFGFSTWELLVIKMLSISSLSSPLWFYCSPHSLIPPVSQYSNNSEPLSESTSIIRSLHYISILQLAKSSFFMVSFTISSSIMPSFSSRSESHSNPTSWMESLLFFISSQYSCLGEESNSAFLSSISLHITFPSHSTTHITNFLPSKATWQGQLNHLPL